MQSPARYRSIIPGLVTMALLAGQFSLAAGARPAGNGPGALRLGNGQVLQIRPTPPSRSLPHAFFDQAMASLPRVYPGSQVVASRRTGYLRRDAAVVYTIVCYRKSKNQSTVTISGVVTGDGKAWSFDADVAESVFVDTLLLVLETIAVLPFDESLQDDAAGKAE